MNSAKSETVAVMADNLHKSYGDVQAVGGLSFTVSVGEVYSLLGPNGAGKTTTVEILEGIRRADKGRTTVLGIDPWHDSAKIRKDVGIMPQGFAFIERITPTEAIRYYCSLFKIRDKSKELTELVELGAAANTQFQNLSGGEKQKLGICLALINDPKLVFLDEPTTGLDPRARRKIWDLIKKLKSEDRTVILTTHYLEEAEILADRVGIVHHGKMLVEGSPKEIIDKMGKGKRLILGKNDELVAHIQNDLKLKVDVRRNDIQVNITGNKDVLDVLTYLNDREMWVGNISLKEDTLEDVFIDLVGEEEDKA